MAKRKKTAEELARDALAEAVGAVKQGETRLVNTAKRLEDAKGQLAAAEYQHKQAGDILKNWQTTLKARQAVPAS